MVFASGDGTTTPGELTQLPPADELVLVSGVKTE
jgi:hypothetical protein